jgi:DNA-binding NarL/FixJ family response regulator
MADDASQRFGSSYFCVAQRWSAALAADNDRAQGSRDGSSAAYGSRTCRVDVCGRRQSNSEIARHLQIGEQTVKNHVSVLLQKLQVRNRVQLAVLAACEWPELLHRNKKDR